MNSTFYKALTVDELKAYGHDNNLKLPQACKKQELMETILNYRDLGLIKSAGDPTASIAIYHHARTSSVRECIQHKLSGFPSYEQVITGRNERYLTAKNA